MQAICMWSAFSWIASTRLHKVFAFHLADGFDIAFAYGMPENASLFTISAYQAASLILHAALYNMPLVRA